MYNKVFTLTLPTLARQITFGGIFFLFQKCFKNVSKVF